MVHTLEDKFLFVGVKPYLSANEIEFLRITLAGNRVNWDKLLTLAYYHHCMPLLYWNLKGMDNAYVPIRILTELKKSYLYACLRNSHCLNQAEDILKAFNTNRIQFL